MLKNFILFFFGVFAFCSVRAQSVNTEFGKNRVQYHDDFKNWWMYETENFITYWYGKGRNVAQFTLQMAEYDHRQIQNVMEHRINDKIEIIVYIDLADLKQSNIGLEDAFINEQKQTKVIGNKIYVYFDGNHQNLRKKIREGVAEVYLNSMMSSSGLQELVRSNLSLDIPFWFQKGIISYMGISWDHLLDDELRNLWEIRNGHYQNFDRLSRDYPKIAGHSFWYFIDLNYGKSTISNLLYLTRINRNLESSFLFVFGISFERLVEEWREYFMLYFDSEENQFTRIDRESLMPRGKQKHVPVSEFRLNPKKGILAFIDNDLGKYRVKFLDLNSGKISTIFKYGYKNSLQETDYNYPKICWNEKGNEISILYEHRNILYLRKYSLKNSEWIEQSLPEDIQRIYSMSQINDWQYLFSGALDGFSDILIYDSKLRQSEKITEDFYDDLEASYVELNGKNGVLFSSNRTNTTLAREKLDTILPISSFDLFFYDLESRPDELIQLTDTPFENERQASLYSEGYISYLSEKSGITNQFISPVTDLSRKIPTTNLHRNIIKHNTAKGSDFRILMYYDDNRYDFAIDNSKIETGTTLHYTNYQKSRSPQSAEKEQIFPYLPEEPEPTDVDELKEGYLFQSKYEDPDNIEPVFEKEVPGHFDNFVNQIMEEDPVQKGVIPFVSARAVAARTQFYLDGLETRLDNEVLFEGLQSYAGGDKELKTQPVGILVKATVRDLFEDYVIEGGIRIPTNFNGSEYFVTFDNNKKLIDQRYAIYRSSFSDRVDELQVFPSQKTKRSTLLGLYRAKYPFDVYRSFRATAIMRWDKLFYLTSDATSSAIAPFNEQRFHLRGEYVYDNTIEVDMNIRFGTRYKFFVEAINRFDLKLTDGFNFELSRGFTTVIGLDARHYIPVLKHSALALRGAAATSIGSDKILYYLGGVEDWVIPSFDNSIPAPSNQNFAYKTIAAHVRGFKHNIRNGGSFVLTNAELRIPLFKYLRKRHIRSAFFRNFQVVGFFDAGLAWHGLSPTGDDNPLNSVVISNPPVITIEVDYFRDPIVMGYGVGLRMALFNYFLRFDYAWGIESRQIQDPIFYFSLGTDF